MTSMPRPSAERTYSTRASGERWAESTRLSLGTPNFVSVSPAWRMVSQSLLLPMRTATRGPSDLGMGGGFYRGGASDTRAAKIDYRWVDPMKRGIWVAMAEEQHLDLSFSRSGRLVTKVPEEGETVQPGSLVARIEEPGLTEDASDYERQRDQIAAQEKSRKEAVAQLEAQLAQAMSEEKRMSRLASEGLAPAADLETLQHKREEIAANIRAREAEKGNLEAQEKSLGSRLDKVRRFEKEGTLVSPAGGMVLTRYHRQGEFIAAGDPIVTLQVEAPYLRVEVPEERLSVFPVGGSVTVWPQARPDARFAAKVVTVKPRAEFATRKNWGLQSRDLKTFSVRLAPQNTSVISGQTFVVEAGRS